MILSCPARFSPSDIMQQLKGRSSWHLQAEFPKLKEMGFNDSVWSRGYYCATFGEVVQQDINDYIGR